MSDICGQKGKMRTQMLTFFFFFLVVIPGFWLTSPLSLLPGGKVPESTR